MRQLKIITRDISQCKVIYLFIYYESYKMMSKTIKKKAEGIQIIFLSLLIVVLYI